MMDKINLNNCNVNEEFCNFLKNISNEKINIKITNLNTVDDDFFVKKCLIEIDEKNIESLKQFKIVKNLNIYDKKIFDFFYNKLLIQNLNNENINKIFLNFFIYLSQNKKINLFYNTFFQKIIDIINEHKDHEISINKKNIKILNFKDKFFHKEESFLLNIDKFNLIFNI